MAACRIMKTALNFSKGAKALKETKKVSLLVKETNLAVQNARNAILKTEVAKEGSLILQKTNDLTKILLNPTIGKVKEAERMVNSYLREGTRLIKNDAKDSIFILKTV